MNEPVAFGKSRAELGAMLDSISLRTDKNHPSGSDKHNSLEFLEAGMEKLSKSSGAKETFGVVL
jgi:hypothetical protein